MSEENGGDIFPEGVLDDLKRDHGDVIAVNAGALGVFAFTRPSQAVNDRLLNKAADSPEKAQAIREAVLSCLCYPKDGAGKPDYGAARTLFEAAPDSPMELLAEIKDLAPKLDIKKL